MPAEAFILGVHLLSVHAQPGYESATVGIYAEAPGGLTAGMLRNSERGLSLYLAQTWHTSDGRWSLTAGGITGYRSAAVTPLLVPSFRMRFDNSSAMRLSYIPKPHARGSSALHLSIETRY